MRDVNSKIQHELEMCMHNNLCDNVSIMLLEYISDDTYSSVFSYMDDEVHDKISALMLEIK